MSIEAAVNGARSGTLVRTGETVTPRDQKVTFGPLMVPVLWNGTVMTRLCPEMTCGTGVVA